MAQLEEIEILIDEKGKVTFQVRGIPGKACLDTTKHLRKPWGMRSSSENIPMNIIRINRLKIDPDYG